MVSIYWSNLCLSQSKNKPLKAQRLLKWIFSFPSINFRVFWVHQVVKDISVMMVGWQYTIKSQCFNPGIFNLISDVLVRQVHTRTGMLVLLVLTFPGFRTRLRIPWMIFLGYLLQLHTIFFLWSFFWLQFLLYYSSDPGVHRVGVQGRKATSIAECELDAALVQSC